MNFIKSLHAGVLFRSFGYQGRFFCSVSALWAFRLDSGEPVLEMDFWSEFASALASGQVLDAGMPKACGEYLVAGSFHAPGGRPVEAGQVRIAIGDLQKTLSIHGDRYWKTFLGGDRGIAGPKPFVSMPITWANAFGGEGFDENPDGKGAAPVDMDGVQVWPLPNVEYPGQWVTSRDSRPRPASLGTVPISWPQRLRLSGTYDEQYLKTRMPWLADDVDWHFFNDASPDQWLPGDAFWKGGESFEIQGMHPDKPLLRGRLPEVIGRCFLRIEEEGRELFEEVHTRLDTVWLLPNNNLGLLIHRGTREVATEDAREVKALLIGHENLSDPRRPLEHYREQLALRTHPEEAFKYLLNTAPLIPLGCRCGFKEIEARCEFPLELLVQQNNSRFVEGKQGDIEAKKAEYLEEARKQLEAGGLDAEAALKALRDAQNQDDPDQRKILELIDKISPGLSQGKPVDITQLDLKAMDELNAFLAQLAARKREEAINTARAEIERLKASVSTPEAERAAQEMERRLEEVLLPPVLTRPNPIDEIRAAQERLNGMRAEMEEIARRGGVSIAELDKARDELDRMEQELAQSQKQMQDSYRMGAHYLGEARSPHAGREGALREEIERRLRAGEPLAGGDWAFVDFSGLDLHGADLSGAFLEYAILENCDLRDANLEGAILAQARIANCDFGGAILDRANLGACLIRDSRFDEASMLDTILAKSRIENSSFRRCRFSQSTSNLLEIQLERVVFDGASMVKQSFVQTDLAGCSFRGTDLTESFFVSPKMRQASFAEANLSSVNFVEAEAEGADFTEANMHNVRFVGKGRLAEACFRGARITGANLREADLRRANFEQACLDGSDLGGADLGDAILHRASAIESQFLKADLTHADARRANLMGANFMWARLVGARLTEANLYSAGFLSCTLGNTDFKGANLDNTILKDWRPS